MRPTLVSWPRLRLITFACWLLLTLVAAAATGYAVWHVTGTTPHRERAGGAPSTDTGLVEATATRTPTLRVIRLTPDPSFGTIAGPTTTAPSAWSEHGSNPRSVTPTQSGPAVPSPSATPAAPELVTNGSFEAGASAWYLEDDAGPVAAPTTVDGTMVLQIPSGGGYADQHVAAAAGETYQLIGSGRITVEGDAGTLGVVYRDAAGTRLTALEPPPMVFTRTRFRAKRLTFTVPAGVVDVLVYAYKEPGSGQFEADAISVRHVEEP